MGGFAAQTQQPQTSGGGGKSGPVGQAVQQAQDQPTQQYQPPQPMGKGGVQTNSATSGQPTMGAPNQYSNTVGQWDNTQQQTQQPQFGGGKGKG